HPTPYCLLSSHASALTSIYTLSLHRRSSDLISYLLESGTVVAGAACCVAAGLPKFNLGVVAGASIWSDKPPLVPTVGPIILIPRSEEHTSELQSRENLVCRLLLEKKKTSGG